MLVTTLGGTRSRPIKYDRNVDVRRYHERKQYLDFPAALQKDEEQVAEIVKYRHETTRVVFLFRQKDSYETAREM